MVQISVIVPVFKVEPYLSRAIDSILRQSVQDFELILVDDGSPDNCGAICDEYAAQDARVRVIHQENRGVSAARNRGLDVATGKYIVFVDSDDWVECDYLKDLLISDADFVGQAFSVYDESGHFLKKYCGTAQRYANSPDTRLTLLRKGSLGYPFSKRFVRKIIKDHGVCFNESINHTEDTLFILDYLQYARTIQIEECCHYCYVRYNTRETLSGKATLARLAMVCTANQIICGRVVPKNTDDYEELFYSRVGYSYMSYIGYNYLSNMGGILKRYFFFCTLLDNEDVNKIIQYAPDALWKLPVHPKVIHALHSKNRLQLVFGCVCDRFRKNQASEYLEYDQTR